MKFSFVIIGSLFLINLVACKKFLDEKNNSAIAVPITISDAQALLDDSYIMNLRVPGLGESEADNYRFSDFILSVINDGNINQVGYYVWGADIFFGNPTPNDWTNPFAAIEKANLALETLAKNNRTALNKDSYDNAKGSALFFRGYYFWKSAIDFSKAYNESSKQNDLGIPLRLSSDFNIVSVRNNVGDTYTQIIKDLTASVSLLPDHALTNLRPSKGAAYGALAEVYLSMRKYEEAGLYADSFLQLNNALIDYNQIDSTSQDPFPLAQNTEIVLYAVGATRSIADPFYAVDSSLYRSYEDRDLRKSVFFRDSGDGASYTFKGRYGTDGLLFYGIATDEIYLIRAECYARAGSLVPAMKDLNTLMAKRFQSSDFTPFTALSAPQALDLILKERRKELIYRNARWIDIKRLNLEGAGITITRLIHGVTYELPPNDNRFAIALPFSDIKISGMKQNPR